jgi:hypothetical protein
LSIPSAAIFALFGVIVALAARDGAGPLARLALGVSDRGFGSRRSGGSVILALVGIVGWLTFPIGFGFLLIWLAGLGAGILYPLVHGRQFVRACWLCWTTGRSNHRRVTGLKNHAGSCDLGVEGSAGIRVPAEQASEIYEEIRFGGRAVRGGCTVRRRRTHRT